MYELKRLFDDFLTDAFFATKPSTPENIHLELELAGVKKEEIKVEVKDSYLSIVVDSQRRKGHRGISLSRYHDLEKASVKYEDGLLTVDIPIKKVDAPKGKLLEIK